MQIIQSENIKAITIKGEYSSPDSGKKQKTKTKKWSMISK